MVANLAGVGVAWSKPWGVDGLAACWKVQLKHRRQDWMPGPFILLAAIDIKQDQLIFRSFTPSTGA